MHKLNLLPWLKRTANQLLAELQEIHWGWSRLLVSMRLVLLTIAFAGISLALLDLAIKGSLTTIRYFLCKS